MFPYGNRMVPHLYLLEIGEIYSDGLKTQFENVVKDINHLAGTVWYSYQEFVRTYRRVVL